MRDGVESILGGARLRVAAMLGGGALLAAAASLLLAPPPAGATAVEGGTADWGVKESFRDYILNAPPPGTISVDDGAQLNEDGTFAFTSGAGEIDGNSGEITFGGKGLFDKDAHFLHVTVADPRVVFEGDQGTLFVDATSWNHGEGDTDVYPNLPYVDLDLSGADRTERAGKITIGPIETTMTAEGQPLLGRYPEGDEMDPLTISVQTPWTGRVVAGKRRAKLTAKRRRAKLATVRCGTEDCAVKTRKRIRAKAKGKGRKARWIRARIAAPASVDAGERANVAVRLSRRDARKLRGRKAKLTAKVRVKGALKPVTRKLTIKVRGAGKRAKAKRR